MARASEARVVLLGERHDVVEDHRWQLDVLAGLLARRRRLVVGFEMFPRQVQDTLDAWSQGTLSIEALVAGTRWKETWGMAPELTLPLLHFTRRHRLPTLALNVSRSLTTRVARGGWSSIPVSEREGIGDPAPPAADYADRLGVTYAEHACRPPETVRGTPAFARFVEAQLVWDRGMAEALAGAVSRADGALVVGLAGSGHLEDGDGIPHQLAALGVEDVVVLLPWDTARACDEMRPGLADFVFGVTPLATEVPPPTRHACEPGAAQPARSPSSRTPPPPR